MGHRMPAPPKPTWLSWTHSARGAEAFATFAPQAVFMEVSLMFSCEFLAANDPQNTPTKTQCPRFHPGTLARPPPRPPPTPLQQQYVTAKAIIHGALTRTRASANTLPPNLPPLSTGGTATPAQIRALSSRGTGHGAQLDQGLSQQEPQPSDMRPGWIQVAARSSSRAGPLRACWIRGDAGTTGVTRTATGTPRRVVTLGNGHFYQSLARRSGHPRWACGLGECDRGC